MIAFLLLQTKKLISLHILQSFLFNYKKESYLARKRKPKGEGKSGTPWKPLEPLCQFMTYDPLILPPLPDFSVSTCACILRRQSWTFSIVALYFISLKIGRTIFLELQSGFQPF